MNITTITLRSPVTQSAAPFSFGQGFKKGDVSASVALDIANYQVEPTCLWNDGSVKMATISGRVDLLSNVSKVISISTGTPPSGAALTSANIVTAAPAASVQCGALGTVNLSSLLASPFRTLYSGPEMVECHYRSDIGSSLMSVWFHVRLFADGRLWIRVVVENCYLDNGAGGLSANTVQNYIPTVIVGGSTVFSNGGVSLEHPTGTRWKADGWIGGDPQVEVYAIDIDYLRSTKLVPNYALGSMGEPALSTLVEAYTPESIGSHFRLMGGTGYQAQIGILPAWCALYVATGDVRARRSVLANSGHINSYAIAFRDKTTNLPIKPSVFPNWSIYGSGGSGGTASSAGSGGDVRSWESSHHPGEGYLAYLLSGEYWHYETLQLQASMCYLIVGSSDGAGTGLNRWMRAQTRGTGWLTRSLCQAGALCRADDAVGAEYKTMLANMMIRWKAIIDTAGINQLGYIYEYNIDGIYGPGTIAPWQQHFWIQSMGFGSDTEPVANMSDFIAVRNWMYKAIVGILGPNGVDNFCYTEASRYNIVISDVGPQDALGWYDSWGDVYTATIGSTNTSCGTALNGTSASQPSSASTGYWGNLIPAIAYAVDHEAPGAQDSFNRMRGASNWSIAASSFDNTPGWGVLPRETTIAGVGETWRVESPAELESMWLVGDRGFGVLGSIIRATTGSGTDGPGVLYNDWQDAGDDTREFRAEVITPPSSGTFYMWEDGTFTLIGAPDGIYTFTYRLWVDGVDLGIAIATINVGAVVISGGAILENFSANGAMSIVTSIVSGGAVLENFSANGVLALATAIISGNVDIEMFDATGHAKTVCVVSGNVSVEEFAAQGDVVCTVALSPTEMRQLFIWVSDLAKIHGLIVGTSLQVSQIQRVAGDIVQTISGGPDNIIVTRQ